MHRFTFRDAIALLKSRSIVVLSLASKGAIVPDSLISTSANLWAFNLPIFRDAVAPNPVHPSLSLERVFQFTHIQRRGCDISYIIPVGFTSILSIRPYSETWLRRFFVWSFRTANYLSIRPYSETRLRLQRLKLLTRLDFISNSDKDIMQLSEKLN